MTHEPTKNIISPNIPEDQVLGYPISGKHDWGGESRGQPSSAALGTLFADGLLDLTYVSKSG
jgi:hypothetical protein